MIRAQHRGRGQGQQVTGQSRTQRAGRKRRCSGTDPPAAAAPLVIRVVFATLPQRCRCEGKACRGHELRAMPAGELASFPNPAAPAAQVRHAQLVLYSTHNAKVCTSCQGRRHCEPTAAQRFVVVSKRIVDAVASAPRPAGWHMHSAAESQSALLA